MATDARGPRRSAPLIAAVSLVAVQAGLLAGLADTALRWRPTIVVQLVGFGVFLVALLVFRSLRVRRNRMVMMLLGGCAAMQFAALLGPPVSSDDDYRYQWDANVQLAGIDPYRYAPDDPALDRVRSPELFPEQVPCDFNAIADGCTKINRPAVHTVYPPVAQAAFDAMRIVSLGGRGNHLPLQLSGAFGVLVSTMLLIRFARMRGSALWPVAVWALNPVVAVEATNNAHIEWLAVLFTVASLIALARGRTGSAGLLIGSAIATKIYPGLMLTAAGRRPWKVAASAASVVALSYMPHLVAVGPRVIGYLPAYITDEHYSSGGRYLLLAWLVGDTAAAYLAPALLAVGLSWLWLRSGREPAEHTALLAFGSYLLVTTPDYAWYALSLIAMIAATGRLEWLWLSFAPSLQYMAADIHLSQRAAGFVGYGAAAIILATVAVRRRRSVNCRPPAEGASSNAQGRPSRAVLKQNSG